MKSTQIRFFFDYLFSLSLYLNIKGPSIKSTQRLNSMSLKLFGGTLLSRQSCFPSSGSPPPSWLTTSATVSSTLFGDPDSLCLCMGHKWILSFLLLGKECRSKLSVAFWSTNLTLLSDPPMAWVVVGLEGWGMEGGRFDGGGCEGGRFKNWLEELEDSERGNMSRPWTGGQEWPGVSRDSDEPGAAIMSSSLWYGGPGMIRAYSVPR